MQHREVEELLALSRLGAAATGQDALISEVLAPLRALTAAEATFVVGRSADGTVVRCAEGLALPVEDLVLPVERGGLTAVAVPGSWAAAGIGTALVHLLPGHCGVLALAWAGSGSS